MAVSIFATARAAFATKQIDWRNDTMRCVIPRAGYALALESDTVLSNIEPIRGFTQVTQPVITSLGWFQCDPIFIDDVPPGGVVNMAIIHRVSNGMLVFAISMPAVTLPAVGPMMILPALDAPGFCRL
jgi:hypothetical protein